MSGFNVRLNGQPPEMVLYVGRRWVFASRLESWDFNKPEINICRVKSCGDFNKPEITMLVSVAFEDTSSE